MYGSDELYEASWPEFTQDDLDRIYDLCAQHNTTHKTTYAQEDSGRTPQVGTEKGAYDPAVSPVLASPADAQHKASSPLCEEHLSREQPAEDSPIALFGKRKYLSVSDIVGPAWCELQYDYGLRQRRKKPVEKRPATFVTKEGKEITVNKKVALKNDETHKGGFVSVLLLC